MRAHLCTLAGLLWLAACSDTDELNCPGVQYRTCDIRTGPCQSLVFDQMRCLRGDEGTERRPTVTVLDADELRAEFETVLDESVDADVQDVYAAAAVLGLLHPDDTAPDSQVEFQLDALLGFYSHVTKQIVVVDHGEPLDDEQATTTLGHEYIHALQDAEFDLQAYQDEFSWTFDSALSATSAIEGEAMLYDGFQLGEIRGQSPEDLDWLDYYSHFTDAANQYNAEERSPLLAAPLVFPYTYGAYAAATLFGRAGQASIARSRRRDLSTQSIMARRSQLPTFVPGDTLADLAVPSISGRRALGTESLGAWLVHGFLVRTLAETPEPDTAEFWRGDVLSVFADDATGAAELIWKVRWHSAARATEFRRRVVESVARNNGSWDARADGPVSVLVASTLPGADLEPLWEAANEAATTPGTPGGAAPEGSATREVGARGHALGRALLALAPHCVR